MRRRFTLLEVMVAVVLLVLIASVTTVQIVQMVARHRFEQQVAGLMTALQEAQVLSAGHQTDFALDLFKKQGRWYYQFSTDEPFLDKKISLDPRPLSQVKKISLEGKSVKTVHWDIYSGGRVVPGGEVCFFPGTLKGSNRVLCLDVRGGYLVKCRPKQVGIS